MRLLFQITLLGYVLLGAVPTRALAQEQKRATLEVTERKREKKTEKAAPTLKRSAVFAMQVERKLVKGIDKTTRYLEKTAKRQ